MHDESPWPTIIVAIAGIFGTALAPWIQSIFAARRDQIAVDRLDSGARRLLTSLLRLASMYANTAKTTDSGLPIPSLDQWRNIHDQLRSEGYKKDVVTSLTDEQAAAFSAAMLQSELALSMFGATDNLSHKVTKIVARIALAHYTAARAALGDRVDIEDVLKDMRETGRAAFPNLKSPTSEKDGGAG
jgi:hypothetical protein